jgi:antitoxin component YwqK of YwqJK toxin-antitoxin module
MAVRLWVYGLGAMKMLAIILALMIPQITMARMGETIEQCDRRYGNPVATEEDSQSRTYLKKGIRIECFFESVPEGKCAHIKYSPIKSIKLAEILWESNNPSWRTLPKDKQSLVYRAESIQTEGYDDMLAWYVEGESLRIDSLEYHKSNPNLDDSIIRKNILAEAIDAEDLEWRSEEGDELAFTPDSDTPYTGWVRDMHENQRINILGQYVDGKQHGLSTEWYENGKKKYEVTYKDGKEHGLLTAWSENGKKISEANMKNHNRHGLETEWHDNRKKKTEERLAKEVEEKDKIYVKTLEKLQKKFIGDKNIDAASAIEWEIDWVRHQKRHQKRRYDHIRVQQTNGLWIESSHDGGIYLHKFNGDNMCSWVGGRVYISECSGWAGVIKIRQGIRAWWKLKRNSDDPDTMEGIRKDGVKTTFTRIK